jgi:hypothetical protein
VSTKELIISELESIPDALLSEVLSLVRSIKHQQQASTVISTSKTRQRTPNLEQGKITMSDDFNEQLPDSFWLGVEE